MRLVSLHHKRENVYGGRLWICSQFLDDIFKKLIEYGADLVFYFDGSIQDEKFAKWKKKQDDSYKLQNKVMNLIKTGGKTVDEILKVGNFLFEYNKNLYCVVRASCEKFGRVYISENYECDREIANFMQKNSRAIGIFANDSDFLIFPGNWRYFSTRDIIATFGVLKTKEYPRIGLRSKLKLDDFQLAFFATLCGCDILDNFKLKHFHHQLLSFAGTFNLEKKLSLRLKISDIVRQNINAESSSHELKNYSKIVRSTIESFKQKLETNLGIRFGFDEKFQKSIEFYLCNEDIVPTYEESPLAVVENMRHKIGNNKILQDSLFFIDLESEAFVTFWKNNELILQRQVGAIMKLHSLTDRKVSLLTKKEHLSKFEIFQLTPEFPTFQLPNDLLNNNNNNGDDIIACENWKLLKWLSCLENIGDFDVKQFPDELVIDIITMTCLYGQKLITLKELDALLWTISAYRDKIIPKKIQIDKKRSIINYRAFCITRMYINLHSYISQSVEICGLTTRLMVSIIE